MRYVDLSATIEAGPAELPDLLRTDIEYAGHDRGARDIEGLLGIGRELLRDGEGWAVETFTRLGTHNTTHVDAPWHYNSTIGGEPAATIDELPLDWFHGPGVVIDATSREDGDALATADLEAELERIGHELRPGDVVLVHTGRDVFYGQPDYIARGPGVSADATVWLCERGVRLMGIDAWGWDAPLHLQAEAAKAAGEPGVFWAAHQCGRAYCQIERLVNLAALPPAGFEVAAFPLKVARGSAGPARVVAILPDRPGSPPG